MKTNIPDNPYKFILTALALIVTVLLCALPALAVDTNQQNDWLGAFLPYLIMIASIAIVIFFPVLAGFMSVAVGLIILGLIMFLLGSYFTGGLVGGSQYNIFNILLSHFYIYIGIILIILDLAMLGSIIISVIGVGFIAWDIGNSIWYSGMSTWGETDMIVFGGLMGITVITAFIYSLRKRKKDKGNSLTCRECGAPITDNHYCTSCGKELKR